MMRPLVADWIKRDEEHPARCGCVQPLILAQAGRSGYSVEVDINDSGSIIHEFYCTRSKTIVVISNV